MNRGQRRIHVGLWLIATLVMAATIGGAMIARQRIAAAPAASSEATGEAR